MKRHYLIFTIGVFCFFILSVPGHSKNDFAEITTNSVVATSESITIVVKIKNNNSINASIYGYFELVTEGLSLENNMIKIIKGVGSVTTKVLAEEDFKIQIEGFPGQKVIKVKNQIPVKELSGVIDQDIFWYSDSIICIHDDLKILAGNTLTINSGTRILIKEKKNLFIDGKIKTKGTSLEPVSFGAYENDKPWGGVIISGDGNDTSFFNHCIFSNGGGDENYIFGHSQSQAVILNQNSGLQLNHCFIVENPGKSIGGSLCEITIENCLFSRNDTGGEYQSCYVEMKNTYITDTPTDDGILVDDDNDATYFYGVHPNIDQYSLIENCVFVTGKDDGIDHNGANLEIRNCFIANFDNEGIAASNYNNVFVYNTLVKNCEQGIEAGYGSPEVFIDHCTLINNDVGIRFGDSYSWGCEGHMVVTNSILYNNSDNILNFDELTQGPVENAIDISYSMTNDVEYNDYPFCITGTPVFDENYYLLTGSPGEGAANDGNDMGIIFLESSSEELRSFITTCNLYPNPFSDHIKLEYCLSETANLEMQIYNSFGTMVFYKSIRNSPNGCNTIIYSNEHNLEGIIYFRLQVEEKILTLKAIAR